MNKMNSLFFIILIVVLLTYTNAGSIDQKDKSLDNKVTDTELNITPFSFLQSAGFADQIKSLDSVTVSSLLSSNKDKNDCVRKFYPFLSSLPSNIQEAMVNVYLANKQTGVCCDSNTMINSVQAIVTSNYKAYTDIITQSSKQNKQSFVCYKSTEFVKSKMKMENPKEERDKNSEFVKSLLSSTNVINMNLAKCLTVLNKITVRKLGNTCLPESTIDKLFLKDYMNTYSQPLREKTDDVALFTECADYFKEINLYTNNILTGGIESLNYVIGLEQCNYFSNFFNFDNTEDLSDPLFPKEVATTLANEKTITFDSVLNQWNSCAKSTTDLDANAISSLYANVKNAQETNPNGLSTYIGRQDINYEIIRQQFNLREYPYYHVQCRNKNCNNWCKNCANLIWDKTKVVASETTDLDVSCCNNACVVYVKILDVLNGASREIKGAEVFLMNNDTNSRNVDRLLVERLKNADNSFEEYKTGSTLTSAFVENTDTQSPKPQHEESFYLNKYQDSPGTSIKNQISFLQLTKKATFNQAFDKTMEELIHGESLLERTLFADTALRDGIKNIMTNPDKYTLDFRYKDVLEFNVQVNSTTTIPIVKFLYEELLTQPANNFNVACVSGICKIECDTCTVKELKLLPIVPKNNTNTQLQATSFLQSEESTEASSNLRMKKSTVSTSKPSSSKSSGSKSSSSKSSSSSSSKGGSSLSSSSSTSKTSSYSSSSSFSSSSSSSKGGSSLTSSPSYSSSSLSSNSKGGSSLTSSTSYSSNSLSNAPTTSSYSSSYSSSPVSYSSSSLTSAPVSYSSSSTTYKTSAPVSYSSSSINSSKTSTSYSSAASKGGSSLTGGSSYKSSTGTITTTNGTPTYSYSGSSSIKTTTTTTRSTTTSISTGGRPNYSTVSYTSTYRATTPVTSSYFTTTSRNYYTVSSPRVVVILPTVRTTSTYSLYMPSIYTTSTIRVYNRSTVNLSYGLTYTKYTGLTYYSFTPSYISRSYVTTVYRPRIYYYQNYYIRNYNSYYYRPPLYVNTSQTYVANSNTVELPAEYDAADWLPATSKTLDKKTYQTNLNNLITKVNIYMQCSEKFCVTLIPNFDDSLNAGSPKQRIFVDYSLRKYSFLNPAALSITQKKCVLQGVLSSSSDKTDIFNQCKVSSPYLINPIKQSCMSYFAKQCNDGSFGETINRLTAFLPTTASQTCVAPDVCLDITNVSGTPQTSQETCGASLYEMYTKINTKAGFEGLSTPCKKSTAAATSFVETKDGSYIKQIHSFVEMSTQSTQYVDTTKLTADDKTAMTRVDSQATTASNSNTIQIDGSTKTTQNTNTASDLSNIESKSDANSGANLQPQSSSTSGSNSASTGGRVYSSSRFTEISLAIISFILILVF